MENSVQPWSWARGTVSLPGSAGEETGSDVALQDLPGQGSLEDRWGYEL